jgi:aromatic ring hydroxylase
MYVSPYSGGTRHPWEHPVSSKHKMLETLTVFDDVFVPWDRVFCFRRPELAGPIALAFVEYHRFTAISTSCRCSTRSAVRSRSRR